jgi:predicted DsbA family dithiol-disulfide isomerase
MQIDIFSDTICPWCFIGKRRLERALAERPQESPEIRWRAFQLNPGMPPEGMERQAYLELKFGGAERAEQVYSAVRAAGEQEGIEFAFERMTRTPNTIQSHRLIHFAGDKGRQDATVKALFEAYFLEAQDIGDTAVLLAAARQAGLDESETEAFLAGDEHREAVLAEDALARRSGVQGVPCFIFEGKYAISGAQEPQVFHQVFDILRENAAETAAGA